MRRLNKKTISKIIYWRERGRSFSEIKGKVKVGYGTLSRYCGSIKILPKFRSRWEQKQKSSATRATLRRNAALKEARSLLRILNSKAWLIVLAALYWAEGTKLDLSFTNTDAAMIHFFVQGLRRVFNVKSEELRITIRTYEDLDKEKCLSYWAKIVGIKKTQVVSVDVLKGKKHGKLKYGQCRVRVRKGGRILTKLHACAKVLAEAGLAPIA